MLDSLDNLVSAHVDKEEKVLFWRATSAGQSDRHVDVRWRAWSGFEAPSRKAPDGASRHSDSHPACGWEVSSLFILRLPQLLVRYLFHPHSSHHRQVPPCRKYRVSSYHSQDLARRKPLEVRTRNDLTAAAEVNGATLSIVDCQSLDRERMAMTLELTGPRRAVQGTITTLREMTGVDQVHELESDSPETRVLMALQKPRICQVSESDGILCHDRPFDSAEVPARWRFTLKKTGSVGEAIGWLGEDSIQARIEDISPLDKNVTLTPKERGIVSVAIERGYFEFPRRITLEDLSLLVGVEVSELHRIFRSLE
jgi:hypothetical protein